MNPFASAKIIGTGVNPAEYHKQSAQRGERDFIMSKSELMEFDRCPHRWIMGYRGKETEAQEWGSLLDCLVLTPDRFALDYAVTPLTYPVDGKKGEPPSEKPWNANSNWCKEWMKIQVGKIPIKAREKNLADGAVKILAAHSDIRDLIAGSDTQVHVVADYKDRETGLMVRVKCLIDLVPKLASRSNALADLKTCASAEPFDWSWAVFRNNYHVQSALYLDAYNAATNEEREDFLHIIQESFGPYETDLTLLSLAFVDLGRRKYLTALQRYCLCLAKNEWPGYEGDRYFGARLVEPDAKMVSRDTHHSIAELKPPTPQIESVDLMP